MGGDTSGGPMWSRFFDSIGGHDDNESVVSGSNMPTDLHTPPPLADSPLRRGPHSPEVHPNDSASVMDDDHASNVDSMAHHRLLSGAAISAGGSVAAPAPPVDDGTYVFKFRTPSARTHRFQARHDNFEHLRDIVAGKLVVDPYFTDFKPRDSEEGVPAPAPDPSDFQLLYTDADGDTVLITSDADVTDAVKVARQRKEDRVVLLVQGGKAWEGGSSQETEAKAKELAAAAKAEAAAVDKAETSLPDGINLSSPSHPHAHLSDDIFGIPRDMILPASIGALAVAIIAVFTISRLSD